MMQKGKALGNLNAFPDYAVQYGVPCFIKPVERPRRSIVGKPTAFYSKNVYIACAFYFSGHGKLDTVHDVLHADWQEAWHDSQSALSLFQLGIMTGTM